MAVKKIAKAATPKKADKKPAKAVAKPTKSAAKPEPELKKEKKVIKRVPPKIVRKAPPPSKQVETDYVPVDAVKSAAFAMDIAEKMKRRAAEAAAAEARRNEEESIRLSRRPTTRAQGKATVKFPAADLKEFRKRLLDARAKAALGADAMKATGFNEAEDHEADGGDGTNQTLRLQALGQMGNINRTIQQIEEALHRIDDGTYGVCTVCGQLIRKPRLLNQPFVMTCMECQNEMERSTK